ncbi:MAG TPA: contact-dependent growth inhibition system immunity protein [Euzebya sp.]|nr:contact-dependent growth inhibition system immunity protein [Euzebya sp.]
MTEEDTLAFLITAYLHQDYDLEFETLEGGVAAFLQREPDRRVKMLVDATRSVLATHPTESAMSMYFHLIHAQVYPPGKGDGTTHVSFVRHILAEAEAELARRSAAT